MAIHRSIRDSKNNIKQILLFSIFGLFLCTLAGGFLLAQKIKTASYTEATALKKSLAIKSYDIQTIAPHSKNDNPYLEIFKKDRLKKTPSGTTIEVPIFMYHHIRKFTEEMTPIARGLTVTPESLEKQLQYFQSEKYTSLTSDQFLHYISSKQIPPKKSILFTFDDGYRDFYQNVYPLFKKYNLHVIVFLIANDIGDPSYLTWEQIREMDASGLIEFGSHTLTHAELSKESVIDQKKQITESKKILEEKLGKKITFFCYPYGKYTKVTISLVKDAGYEGALTTHFGISHGQSNIYEMPRVRIEDGDIDVHLKKKMKKLLNL